MLSSPVTVLGFGELGSCVARLLRAHEIPTHVWRRARTRPGDNAQVHANELGVELHTDLASAVARSALVISCLPGAVSLAVANDAAPHLTPGVLFVDAASARPEDKQRAEERVLAAGGAYVDGAVLGSVAALGAEVPWLISGPSADRFGSVATALGMRVTVLRAPVGGASRVKLLRSIYLKGRDALVAEMALAAHAYGLLPDVVGSIGGPAEQVAFPVLAERILRSTAKHSSRRSVELDAAARVLQAVGVAPLAAEGALRRLQALASSTAAGEDIDGQEQPAAADLVAIADEVASMRTVRPDRGGE